MKKDLDLVMKYQKEMSLLRHASVLLEWDKQTMMPKKGIKIRAETLSFLSRIIHEKFTSDELYIALKRLKKINLYGDDKIIVDKLYREIVKSRKIPKELVEELSRATSLAYESWMKAREKKDFEVFRPYLEKIVRLKRKEAKYINLPGHPYNSLLDSFEEGMTVEELDPVFNELKGKIISLSGKIRASEKYKKQKLTLLKRKFSKEVQMKFVRDVIKRIGLKEENSRIDFSEHPFTEGIGRGDVRITTNMREDPLFSFNSTIHEAGHALYELGFPEKHAYDILGDSPSHGIHESQSRFWENMVGKGEPFWRFYYSKFNKELSLKGKFSQWMEEVNHINPSLIRIESDEVHYSLHVILRYEIEKGLIDGKIKVRDLPKIWNNKMKLFLGITPKNDKEGVLQDVHWSSGYIGYFPTYLLGSIYSAQLYSALKKDHPDIGKDIRKGNFARISKWLLKKIHGHGSKYLAEDLIKKVCGEGLNPDAYIDYLTNKYAKIYNLKN